MISHAPPGVLTEFGPALREPCGRIHWAGTESSAVMCGWVDGAVRSGARASAEVMRSVRVASLNSPRNGRPPRVTDGMAKYRLNKDAVAKARKLIDARQYVLDSDWGDVQPNADAQNTYLENHSWDEYSKWHLGLTDGAADETKARYAFVYGDLRRVHRTGLIACVYRAAEWRHKDVEVAAHELLQYLDRKTGLQPSG